MHYINVSRLEYESFNFITSISYSYSIIVLLPVSLAFLALSESSAFSDLGSPVLLSSLSFSFKTNKLLNFFRAVFTISGTFRPSILFFKSALITLTICKMASVTKPSVYSRLSWELIVSIRVLNIYRNL